MACGTYWQAYRAIVGLTEILRITPADFYVCDGERRCSDIQEVGVLRWALGANVVGSKVEARGRKADGNLQVERGADQI